MRELIEEVFVRHLGSLESTSMPAPTPSRSTLDGGELDDHDRRLHRAAARVPGRRHRLAGGARHGQRSRGRRRGAALSESQRVLEEGLEIAMLERIVASLAAAARDVGRHSRRGRHEGACVVAKAAACISPRPASASGRVRLRSAISRIEPTDAARQRPDRRSRHRRAARARGLRICAATSLRMPRACCP